jgi:hypothetical protein
LTRRSGVSLTRSGAERVWNALLRKLGVRTRLRIAVEITACCDQLASSRAIARLERAAPEATRDDPFGSPQRLH